MLNHPVVLWKRNELEGYALVLREELEIVIHDPVFDNHVKDVIDFRTMDYYQRR